MKSFLLSSGWRSDQRNSLTKAGKKNSLADHARVETWQKNGCQASEMKLRPSRRREAATVTAMTPPVEVWVFLE